jgi:hypothetical protein
MKKIDIGLEILKKSLGLPYRWGGNDPIVGFDCSGLMVEVLQGVGILKKNTDYTAHGLSKLFAETDILKPGVMVYWDWNKDGFMDHVEMIAFIDDDGQLFTIGASGGDSTTSSENSASSQNAYVKLRPLLEGWHSANDPFASSL